MAITRSQNKRRKVMLIANDVVVVGDRREGGGGGSRDWLLLPPEILHCVVGLFDFPPDLLAFSSVCRDWRTAGLSFRRQLLSPLLFFSSGLQTFRKSAMNILISSDNDDDGVRRFLSLSENKGFRLQLPPDMESKWWCIGSSYGWLILADKSMPLYSDIQLFNPFAAKKNAVVRLPPIRTLTKDHERSIARRAAREGFSRHNCFAIGRAFLSCNPRLTTTDNKGGVGVSSSWNKSCLVMVLRHDELFLCRPGDDRWKRISPGFPRDAIFFQGCLYALMVGEEVVRAYDIDYNSLVQSVGYSQVKQKLVPSASFPFDHLFKGISDKYLVQSSGELLMILRKIENVSGRFKARSDYMLSFSLFKLNQQKGEWTEVHDIGDDQTIFIGNSQSMCLSSHDYPGWKTNCIYFIPCKPRGAGVFDLKQGTISSFDISDLRGHDVLFWFTPDMNWR